MVVQKINETILESKEQVKTNLLPVDMPQDNTNTNNKNILGEVVLKRRQTNSPKLENKDLNEALSEITEGYQYLSIEDKEEANQIANETFNRCINNLTDDEKAKFFANFKGMLQSLKDDKEAPLSNDDRNEIASFLTSSTDENAKEITNRFGFGNIANIMMIIVKVFTESMNAEGIDEVAQVNDTNLMNSFLDKAQEELEKNINNTSHLIDSQKKAKWKFKDLFSTKGWKEHWRGNIEFLVVTAVVVATIGYGGYSAYKAAGECAEVGALGTDGFVASKAGNFCKILKGGVLGSGNVIGGALIPVGMLFLLLKTTVQDEINNQLGLFSDNNQRLTGIINQDNTIQQTSSKRISDDSEQINRSSGYVSQAIAMFGQAYQFRV